MRGAERYQKYIKYVLFVMVAGFLVFITPHTMVMSPAELKAMGGQQHPVLGNFGVMSAKNGGINVLIVATILSFIWYQRGNKVPTVSWVKFGNIFMGCFFAIGALNIIWLAIYGYYIPANVRVGLSVPQGRDHPVLSRLHDHAQSHDACAGRSWPDRWNGGKWPDAVNTLWSCWRLNSLG